MKLSIDTYIPVKRFGEEKAFYMIKDAGFDCIDYSFYWLDENIKEKVFGSGYIEHANKIKELLCEIGISCNQAHAPFDFNPSKGDTIDISNKNYMNVVRSLEIASILGAKSIVVHAIDSYDGKSKLEANYEYYKSFEPYLKKYGIRIAVENLFGVPYDDEKKIYLNNRFDRPALMLELLNKLGSDLFVCCLDIGHATITGIEPQDYIRGMSGGLLQALHVQDNDYKSDKHVLPYTGLINWDEVAKSLRETHYDGELTFEIFNFLNKFDDEMIPSALEFAQKTGRHIISKIIG